MKKLKFIASIIVKILIQITITICVILAFEKYIYELDMISVLTGLAMSFAISFYDACKD